MIAAGRLFTGSKLSSTNDFGAVDPMSFTRAEMPERETWTRAALASFALGDSSALPEFRQLWSSVLEGAVRNGLRWFGRVDEEDVEEGVQEALILLLEIAHTFDPQETPEVGQFIGRAAHKAVQRMLRGRSRKELRVESERMEFRYASHPAPNPTPAAELELKETAAEVEGAVATLPPAQRRAVQMFYYDDLSVREVADAMGVAQGTATGYLHSARQALRSLLGPVSEAPTRVVRRQKLNETADESVHAYVRTLMLVDPSLSVADVAREIERTFGIRRSHGPVQRLVSAVRSELGLYVVDRRFA